MIFEIYSMGDGLYMKRILDGVAMMSNDGFLLALGSFGLILGLFLAALKAVETGGQKIELPSLFVSFLLILAMFSVKVDTVVYALDGAPGASNMSMYTVDNVPVGVAFPSMMTTTLGKVITEKFQQAFSVPGMEDLGLKGGQFGNTLKLVDMARRWDIEGLGGGANNKVPVFRRNLVSYVSNCTIPGIQRGAIDKDALLATATPITSHANGQGIGFNDKWTSTPMMVGGSDVDLDCDVAMRELEREAADEGMMSAFLTAAMNMTDARSGADSASMAATAAFTAIGASTSTIQQHVMASAVREIMDEAISGSSALTPNEIQSQIMLIQGSRQRQDEWGAGEIMFRKAMRPFMAFLECFAFIAAPFMVLAIGLGQLGLRMVGKYFMVNLWIMTWAPMFAAVDLFQITMVQHAIKAMQVLNASSNGVPLSSIAGAAALNSELTTWIAVGGWMATLVPPMGYLLLSGGAVAMTSFAGRMAGQDHVNEKMTSPDLASVKEAMSVNSQLSYSQGMGSSVSGVDNLNGSFSFSGAASSSVDSSRSAMESAQRSASAQLNKTISSTLGQTSSVRTSDGVTMQAGHSISDSMAHSQGSGTTSDQSTSADLKKADRESTTFTKQGNVTANMSAGQSASEGAGGGQAAKGAGSSGVNSSRNASGSAGISGGLTLTNQQVGAQETAFGRSAKVTEGEREQLDRVVKADSAASKQEMLQRMADSGSSVAKQVLDSYNKSQAAQDLKTTSAQYAEAERVATTASSLSGTSVQAFSHHVASQGPGAVEEAVARAREAGGDAAFSLNLQQVHDQQQRKLFAGDEGQARAMAAAMTLAGTGSGAYRISAGSEAERLEALADLSNKYSVGAGSASVGNAHGNGYLTENAPMYGDVLVQTKDVSGAGIPNEGAVRSAVGADIAGGSGADMQSVAHKAGVAAEMGNKENRDDFFQHNHAVQSQMTSAHGAENMRQALAGGRDIASDLHYGQALGDVWGSYGLGDKDTGSVMYSNYLAAGKDGSIQQDSGASDVPFQRSDSKAEQGTSGLSRFEEIRREVAAKSGLASNVIDENAVNVVAAATLFRESRGLTSGGAYLSNADADRLEHSFQALNQNQVSAIFGDTLHNDLPNVTGGDGFTSAALGMALIKPSQESLPKPIAE
ncbi:conjugal transfer protein TraG N-terminal domain-containing protein (plasmid) [Xanthomonas citri pv. citri]|uniref:conjugal transfer protein TraG N-terminal domain-containing protein n=1 Tax=Xanthomonas citri TaxID=346 RepID=UPI0019333218|nr:conjugal transfer protein TraG N-terminal domain-containing protein [Xanthomonas citri]QRD62637.1 conjugal transfer protein TraG N-terminal domain-containing protein [Xanthomonas citri pv. citri]QRD67172.1 conjugal transfer protein TraG N-terminal domain-containing protein [Xanthomonas citri pv. citri]QRD71783.1 conjugal transfer protein TraG N-terminal domain-containing protein [Xanthomonas citri pv. citri]